MDDDDDYWHSMRFTDASFKTSSANYDDGSSAKFIYPSPGAREHLTSYVSVHTPTASYHY